MSYTTTVSNNNVIISVSAPEHKLDVNNLQYSVSLSRTGGQGAKGDYMSNAYINSSGDLIIEIANSVGNIVEVINAGNIFSNIKLERIANVLITDVKDGDYIVYDSTQSKYINHKLTTSKVLDIDNTNKQDGALLVYNGTTEKYIATTAIENPNTTIIGGSF